MVLYFVSWYIKQVACPEPTSNDYRSAKRRVIKDHLLAVLETLACFLGSQEWVNIPGQASSIFCRPGPLGLHARLCCLDHSIAQQHFGDEINLGSGRNLNRALLWREDCSGAVVAIYYVLKPKQELNSSVGEWGSFLEAGSTAGLVNGGMSELDSCWVPSCGCPERPGVQRMEGAHSALAMGRGNWWLWAVTQGLVW